MTEQTVKVVITTDATGAITGIQNFQKELGKTQSVSAGFATQLKENWLAASAAVAGALMAATKAMAYMEEGARALAVESSFKIMADAAGVNSARMIASMKAATKSVIDDSQMMQKAVKLMTLGYDPAQIERFSKVVITASQIAGTSAADAYDKLADAIANKAPKAMVQMGAVTKEQMKIVTKAIESGADSMALFELAMANLELKQKMLQGTQNEATLGMQRFKAQAEELKESLGKGLLVIMQVLFGAFQAVAAGALMIVGGIWKMMQGIAYIRSLRSGQAGEEGKKELADLKSAADAAFGAANELAKKSQDNFSLTAESSAKATKSQIDDSKKLVKSMEDKLKATVAAANEAKDILKSEMDANKKAYETEIEMAEHAAKMRVLAGEDDLQVTLDIINQKQNALNEWFDAQADAINQHTETYEIAAAKISALNTDYKKQWQQFANQREEIEYQLRKRLIDIQISYLKDMDKTFSDEYRSLSQQLIQIEADSLENKFKSLSGNSELDKQVKQEQDATRLLMVEWEERLRAYAEYLNGMGRKDEAAEALKSAESIAKKKIDLDNRVTKNALNGLQVVFDKEAWISKKTSELDNNLFQQKTKMMTDSFGQLSSTFDGISKLYKEGSSEANRWKEASQAMLIAQKAVAVVQAVGAIATQGLGDPYTAFVRIAAMAAAMGALLATIGESVNGTGAAMAAVKPASTVLGAEAGVGSESITNSLKLLEETYTMEATKLTKIYNELKDLNNNITGLVTSIVRTGGISAAGMNLNLDYLKGDARKLWEGQNDPNNIVASFFTAGLSRTPLLQWVTNFFGSLGETIFGGGISSTITSQGIEIGSTIIKNILNGADVSARQYANVRQEHSGGWFSSSWYSGYTAYAALDKNVTDMLTLVFENIGTTLIELSKALGTDTQKALDYVIAGTQLNLQGMNTEQMNKALQEYISNIADNAVDTLFGPMLKGYQKLNEGLMETAVRLITDKETILNYLKLTNQAFNGTIPEAIKFSETLITIAGGLDKLTDALNTYYDAFFSDAEKQSKLKEQMTAMLGMYGFDLPGSRAGYRDLVESLNLTTEAGMTAYVALMQMSKSADEYYKYVEAAKGNIKPENYATYAEYMSALNAPAFASGGTFAGGYRIVGENGPELEFTGPSRIYSNKDSKALLNTDELVAEIRTLRQELGAGNFANAANSAQMAKLLSRWDGNGMPPERT